MSKVKQSCHSKRIIVLNPVYLIVKLDLYAVI